MKTLAQGLTRRHAQVKLFFKSPNISKTIQIFTLNQIYSYILWQKVSSNIAQEVPQVYPLLRHSKALSEKSLQGMPWLFIFLMIPSIQL